MRQSDPRDYSYFPLPVVVFALSGRRLWPPRNVRHLGIVATSLVPRDYPQSHGSITNLFGSVPPVDLQTYGGGAELAYSTLDQDGAVGRFFLVGATYKF
jgi:hypothetical protein